MTSAIQHMVEILKEFGDNWITFGITVVLWWRTKESICKIICGYDLWCSICFMFLPWLKSELYKKFRPSLTSTCWRKGFQQIFDNQITSRTSFIICSQYNVVYRNASVASFNTKSQTEIFLSHPFSSTNVIVPFWTDPAVSFMTLGYTGHCQIYVIASETSKCISYVDINWNVCRNV
jgi:hypothetical protein